MIDIIDVEMEKSNYFYIFVKRGLVDRNNAKEALEAHDKIGRVSVISYNKVDLEGNNELYDEFVCESPYGVNDFLFRDVYNLFEGIDIAIHKK